MKNAIINRWKVYLVWSAALSVVFFAPFVSAKDYTFSWADSGLIEGYMLYYKEGGDASVPFDGISANEGRSPINIGNATSFTISGLEEGETYHFALTAYVGSNESDFTDVITVGPGDTLQKKIGLIMTLNGLLILNSD
jgi:hypothetical protein